MRAVVITGTSTGIGRACALDLDARGLRVFAGVRKEEDAEALRRVASPRLEPLLLDVTEDASIRRAAARLGEALGGDGLAGLVNNAGISVSGPLEHLPLERVREQLEVNLLGPLAVTQALLPFLRREAGRIVNIGSISGRFVYPLLGPYAMSKFGLAAMSDALRRELAPWGIRVALVEPGAIATPIWRKGLEADGARLPDEARARYGPMIEAVRRGAAAMARSAAPPERVARAVRHALTSPRPRTRYLVGRDARLTALAAWLLPDRILDALVRRRSGPEP